jgi:hypothetical protein
MFKTNTNRPFAEVIESSLTGFTAQSWQWNVFPAFGSLLTVETKTRQLFGIVSHIQTGSMDPTRSPFPYQKTEAELLAEQPQIFEFLKTTFYCLIVGYQEKEILYYLLAPQPPQIHTFVTEATSDQSSRFFASDQYLHLLFGAAGQTCSTDDLLLAILSYQAQQGILTTPRLQSILKNFSLLTGNDYRRLKLLAHRIEQNIIP